MWSVRRRLVVLSLLAISVAALGIAFLRGVEKKTAIWEVPTPEYQSAEIGKLMKDLGLFCESSVPDTDCLGALQRVAQSPDLLFAVRFVKEKTKRPMGFRKTSEPSLIHIDPRYDPPAWTDLLGTDATTKELLTSLLACIPSQDLSGCYDGVAESYRAQPQS